MGPGYVNTAPPTLPLSSPSSLRSLQGWLKPSRSDSLKKARQLQYAVRAETDTHTSPLDWATANARIVTPSQGVAPWEPYGYQEKLLEDTASRRLVLKARQTGLSTAIALEALYYATHFEHDRTLFVSRNQELAGLLIRYAQVAIAGMADSVRPVAESQSKIVFSNGSEIVSLPANPATGRGYPASRVYLDEFAFAEYDELIMQSIAPTLSDGGQLTVLSTPKGRNNLFFKLWQGFEGGAWSRHTVHWSDCPRYTEAWAAVQRQNMTRQAFAEEFDLDFAASGDAVFRPEDLQRAHVGWDPDANTCTQFIHAWDIGRRQDNTVGLTIGLRGDTWHEVKLDRFQAPYPVIQDRIEARHVAQRGVTWVESNGVGDPVIENLNVTVEPFTTTTRTKVQAIQSLVLLLEQGRFKYGNEQLDRELSLYQWDDKNLVQDCVMAAAIAAHAAEPDPKDAWARAIGSSAQIGYGEPPKPHPFGAAREEMERDRQRQERRRTERRLERRAY